MGVIEDRRRIIAAQPHLVTASGSSVLVNIAEPKIERLEVTFSPVQTGSGDPSPSNVRTIYGWTEIPTQMCGKNLIPPTIHCLANSQGAIVAGDSYRSLIAVVNGGATYTISRNAVSGNRFRAYATREYPASGVPSVTVSSTDDNVLQKTITVPDGYSYLLVYLSNSGDDITSTIQLELGSTATAYEPYRGITATADLGGTYYGGVVDLVSGVMTVTRAAYDLGLNPWNYLDSSLHVFNTHPGGGMQRKLNAGVNYISDIYQSYQEISINGVSYTSMPMYNIACHGTANYSIFVRDDRASSVAELKSLLSGHYIVYELATPQTVTLTPQTIGVLRGQQTVTSPAGSVEISYWTH